MKKGQKMSDEQRLKISQAHKGKKKPWSGKYMTTEHRKSISERMLGNKLCLGRKLSDEVKEKIRVSNLGKVHNISDEGMERMRKKNYVVWNKGKSCRDETKQKISISGNIKRPWMIGNTFSKGEKNGRYIKDRTKLKKSDRRWDTASQEWWKNCKIRDNWQCRLKNSECSTKIEVHHIYSWKDFPELRYDLDNGITLCTKHHPRKRSEEIRLRDFFKSLIID